MGELARHKERHVEKYQVGEPERPYVPEDMMQSEPSQESLAGWKGRASSGPSLAIVGVILLVIFALILGAAALYLLSRGAGSYQNTVHGTWSSTSSTLLVDKYIEAAEGAGTVVTSYTVQNDAPSTTLLAPQSTQNKTLKVGEAADYIPGHTVSVLEVLRAQKYAKRKSQQSAVLEDYEAEGGFVFIIVKARLTNSGMDKIFSRRTDYRLSDSDGTAYTSERMDNSPGYTEYPYISEVNPGMSTEGYIRFTVPEKSQGYSVYYVMGKDPTTGKTQYYRWVQ